jgi:cytochrome c-type biogenesis protein CcmH/NrfG
VKLNPANGDCWNVLAHVLFKKKDYEGASKAI